VNRIFIVKSYRLINRSCRILFIFILIFLLGRTISTDLAAQDLAIGSADALVLSSISISSVQGLSFGDVRQGIPKTIPADNSNAAILRISGASRSGINLRLQLPSYMTHTLGHDRLVILFGPTSVSVDTTAAGDPTAAGISGWINIDPYSLPNAAVIGSGGTDIYLGGEVIPSSLQSSGTYEAEIVLTVAYNNQ
jgi:hypothetical protein